MCAHVRAHTHAHMHPPFHPPMHTHIHRALERGLGGRDEPKEQVINTGKEQKMTNVRHNFSSYVARNVRRKGQFWGCF